MRPFRKYTSYRTDRQTDNWQRNKHREREKKERQKERQEEGTMEGMKKIGEEKLIIKKTPFHTSLKKKNMK